MSESREGCLCLCGSCSQTTTPRLSSGSSGDGPSDSSDSFDSSVPSDSSALSEHSGSSDPSEPFERSCSCSSWGAVGEATAADMAYC